MNSSSILLGTQPTLVNNEHLARSGYIIKLKESTLQFNNSVVVLLHSYGLDSRDALVASNHTLIWLLWQAKGGINFS